MIRRLAVLLVACGGDPDTAPAVDARIDVDAPATADAAPVAGCGIALGGALSGTFPCDALFTRRDGDSVTVVGIGGSYAGAVQAISIAARLRGAPEPRELAEADFESLVFSASGMGESFTASGGGGPSIGLIGRLSIASVQARPGAGLTEYVVHGTFNAVLTGAQGHGTVTLSATF